MPKKIEINRIHNMDCLEGMKLLDDNSIDSIVTDPPYELGFMGKKWDSTGIAYNVDVWRECLRVLKPGGHLLAFGGTRTYHRMACAIEDAGFEIRDSIQEFFATDKMAQEFLESLTQEQFEVFWRLLDAYGLAGQMAWVYGSGFPKSMDISKAIDKAAGATREIVGTYETHDIRSNGLMDKKGSIEVNITAPSTPKARQWQGWGTALKPANEPICVARKPISEKTIADNVLKWGTGGLNIDGCRVEYVSEYDMKHQHDIARGQDNATNGKMFGGKQKSKASTHTPQGRFPANVILDEEAGKMLDEQSGILKSGGGNKANKKPLARKSQVIPTKDIGEIWEQNSGGASRFFYCAKASKKERGEGNNHPTVKPVSLIKYLVTLVTPPDGVCLDPFMGSGTTAVACIKANRDFIGFELDPTYYAIAEERIKKAIGGAESNKIIKAQRQEIEKIKATLADWKYNAKCDADHIAALTADKDEQTEQMKYLLRRTLPILEVTNDQQELIDAINALIGGKEDV
jgi:site-specific DNA-methyltransferase (adenine-specific)